MLTDPVLKGKVDKIWDKLWSGGLSIPLDAIEQLSYLLFLKRLDDMEAVAERVSRLRETPFVSRFPSEDMRWRAWTKRTADDAFNYVRDVVFPAFKQFGATGSSFRLHMENAEFKISKPSVLIEVCNLIDEMEISSQNQDVQGDIYEYLLSKLKSAGRNGQFRTPRHIIRLMVRMVDPRVNERICDPAAGTCGFLVNAYQYILEKNTSASILSYDEEGIAHNLVGDRLSESERSFLQAQTLSGFDNDSGMTMLRIGAMNLMLHGIESPNYQYADALSKAYTEESKYDVVLANPPFKGAIDSGDVSDTLPARCLKTEILFLHLFLRILDSGGRCAAIVPEGILFRSSGAHLAVRRRLVEENRLEGVISMPGGVFKPYSGVSTAILLFTKNAKTEDVWFYDMEHDGFSLDDKRLPVAENDIPDILRCWENRNDEGFIKERELRRRELSKLLEPLKLQRHLMLKRVDELHFQNALAAGKDSSVLANLELSNAELKKLQDNIRPLQLEANRLSRSFSVPLSTLRENRYELGANSYRKIEEDESFVETPRVLLERMGELEKLIANDVAELATLNL